LEQTLNMSDGIDRSRHDIRSILTAAGLRPTRQRIALSGILFCNGDRHVTAEMLYEEATAAKIPVSLATVYNTLRRLTKTGLLRQITADSSKIYVDTNSSHHHHFFIENEKRLIDIPAMDVSIPAPPPGYKIESIDIVIRLKREA
jgi:Fur family iron response transcriptional regulator